MKKIALVTGSTKGIGKAIACKLIEQGFCVVFTGRNVKDLEHLNEIFGDKCIPLCVDFSQEGFLKKIAVLFSEIGLLPDVIIHNVGMRVESDKQPLSYSAMLESLHINMGVAVEINAYFIPLFLREMEIENWYKGGGDRVIMHISSNSAINGNGAPGYVMAKAGLNAYIKSTARYYAKKNLIIAGVMPGIIEFDGGSWDKKTKDSKRYDEELAKQPLGRFGTTEEVANFVVSLCVMKNPLTNGEIFMLSGGL